MELERTRAATPAPATPPTPNFTFNIPPTSVQAQVNVEPTPLTVNNQVAPPNVQVTNQVEPTPVQVNNQVPAPVVNVNNDVKPADVVVTLPDRQTKTNITRNDNGEIVDVTQIETTV